MPTVSVHSMHDDQVFMEFNRKTFLYGYRNEVLMTKQPSSLVLPSHCYVQKAVILTEQQTDLIRNGLENTVKTMYCITENLVERKTLPRDFTLLAVPLVLFSNVVLPFLTQVIIQLSYLVAIFCTSKETFSFAVAILPL